MHPKQPEADGPEREDDAAAPREMKFAAEPIVMVTAYDHPSAQVAEAAGVDIVLVGDSAAMTVLGYDSTVPVGMEEMVMLAAAVRRGLKTPLLVGDMPFGSYERSERAGDRERAALRQGGRLRRGQARARWRLGRPRAGDHPRRHSGDGPRRPHPADGDRARRLQGAGQDRRASRPGSPRRRWRCRRSAASRSSSRRSRRASPRC